VWYVETRQLCTALAPLGMPTVDRSTSSLIGSKVIGNIMRLMRGRRKRKGAKPSMIRI